MKTDLLTQTADDASASTDSTSEYSLIDGENMEQLREKIINQDLIIRDFETKLTDAEGNILNQNEKIRLYEATIRDKNDLIKSLNMSIELMKENKDLAIKQLKDQIADLQNAPDLSKNLTSNKHDANAAESAEFERNSIEKADFLTLQKQFADSQSQIETLKDIICQLKSTNIELKSKLDENIQRMAILEEKSATEENELRAKIAELEKNAEIHKAESKEEDAKLAKFPSNDKSWKGTDAPFVLLNHSKVPNLKHIKVGNEKKLAIVEDIPTAGSDWIVIMRRFDGSVDFERYSLNKDFGELRGEFWFGLESIHKLTSKVRHELYIQLVDFDDVTAYARYDRFSVTNEESGYALKLGAYSGNAGDALRSHENSKMSVQGYTTWWWFLTNNQCCLTGPYSNSKEVIQGIKGMYWGNWYLGKRYPLKACKMLIRPFDENVPPLL